MTEKVGLKGDSMMTGYQKSLGKKKKNRRKRKISSYILTKQKDINRSLFKRGESSKEQH